MAKRKLRYKRPTDEDLRNEAVIQETRGQRGRGYTLGIEARPVGGPYETLDDARLAANWWMEQNNFFPNLYFINERGNIDLLGRTGTILASWV